MKRTITGYHRDAERDWVAELDCFHNQHVRHKPPFTLRPWVESAAGREAHLGHALDCVLCDRGELPDGLEPYRRTPEFTERTVPAGLLKHHATKRGVWGRLVVLEGALEYVVEEPVQQARLLAGGEHAIIVPEALHAVRPRGAVRFYVEFLTRPAAPD